MIQLPGHTKLQLLTKEDASLLSNIAIKAYKDHYLHLWDDGGEWYINNCFNIARLESELADANAVFYLVYHLDMPVGFVKLNINPSFAADTDNPLELERIYLMGHTSGNGIGSNILVFIVQLATEMGKAGIVLKVMDSSAAAIRFYHKMGFVITGNYQLDFPQMLKHFRGMYIMEKTLLPL